MQHVKESCIEKLGIALRKVVKTEDEKQIVKIVEMDMRKYLGIEPSGEYMTTQHVFGMKYIFRGWVVKCWRNVNDEQSDVMYKTNKIIVKQSVKFYSEA